jgi:hypothetical protein
MYSSILETSVTSQDVCFKTFTKLVHCQPLKRSPGHRPAIHLHPQKKKLDSPFFLIFNQLSPAVAVLQEDSEMSAGTTDYGFCLCKVGQI